MAPDSAEKMFARRHLDRERAKSVPPPNPAEGSEEVEERTWKDTFKDKAFGEMLDAEGDPDLIELGVRIRTGKEDADDIKEIIKWHKEYLNREKRAESLNSSIDSYLAQLRATSTDLDDFAQGVGEENFGIVLKAGIREQAFKDPKAFKKIETMFTKLSASEKALDDPKNPVNKVLLDFSKKHSSGKHTISNDALDTIMQEANPHTRALRIRDEMRKGMGFFRRSVDTWRMAHKKPSALDDAQVLSRHKSDIEAATADFLKEIKKSSTFLFGLTTTDPVIRAGMMRAAKGDTPDLVEGIDSKMSFAEAGSLDKKISRSHIRSAWADYLADKRVTDFSTLSPADQVAHQDKFWNGEAGKPGYATNNLATPGKKGFWAKVRDFVLGNKYKDAEIQGILK